MSVPHKFATEFTQIDVKKLDENFDSISGPTGIKFPDGTIQNSAAWDTFKSAQTFTTSGSWTCPDGIYLVQLTMFGGGGNGGVGATYVNGGTTFYSGGGGGGSSAVINNYRVAVVPGTEYTVTVGAATLPSSFGPLVTINPGVSGVNAAGSNTGDGGAGGAAYDVGSTTNTSTDRSFTYPQSSAGNNGTSGTANSNNNAQIGGDGGSLPIFNYAGGTTNGASAAANTGAGGAGTNYTGTGGSGGSGLVIVQW